MAPLLFTKNAKANENNVLVKQTFFAMGTIVSFTASHSNKEEAYNAFQKALEEINRLEVVFSRHDKNSALSVLNTDGKLAKAPAELLYVLNESLVIANKSKALYNPAVKPLLDLFEAQQDIENVAKSIDSKAIIDAQNRMDYKQIQIANSNIHFKQEGMSITLDSIAKGYIIDKASDVLVQLNIKNHIINAGGDIIAKGYKSSTEPWIIGVENPYETSKLLAQFPLINAAVATSGSYQRYFDKDAQRHHIINPVNAISPSITSITCKANSAMLADAYSTACSLNEIGEFAKFRIFSVK